MIKWPNSIIKDIARRKCVIFLGAGISKNASNADGIHPKNWQELLTQGANALASKKVQTRVKNLIKATDYLMACELLKRAMGRDEFVDFLSDEYQRPRFEPAEIHKDIFLLDSRIIVTPNFDRIYDAYALSEAKGSISIKHYYDTDVADKIRKQEPIILKIHGCIETPDRLVFSKIDYARARNQYQNFYKILEALILTHTFIFLGAGINDPDIKLLLEDYAFKYSFARRHYFVTPKNTLITEERTIYEEAMNLQFIEYDSRSNHKELLDSIKELVSLVESERRDIADKISW